MTRTDKISTILAGFIIAYLIIGAVFSNHIYNTRMNWDKNRCGGPGYVCYDGERSVPLPSRFDAHAIMLWPIGIIIWNMDFKFGV